MVKRKTKSSKKCENEMEILRGTSEAACGDPQIRDKGADDPVGSASRGGPTRSEQKQQTVHSVAESRSRRTSHRSQRRGDSIKTKSAHKSSRRVSQPRSRSRPRMDRYRYSRRSRDRSRSRRRSRESRVRYPSYGASRYREVSR